MVAIVGAIVRTAIVETITGRREEYTALFPFSFEECCWMKRGEPRTLRLKILYSQRRCSKTICAPKGGFQAEYFLSSLWNPITVWHMHSLMRKSRLFLDTNIHMDFLFDREIQKDSTNAIIQMGIDGVYENCISILSLVTVAYVAIKYMDNCRIGPVLKECSDMFTVLPSDNAQHLLALSYNGRERELQELRRMR